MASPQGPEDAGKGEEDFTLGGLRIFTAGQGAASSAKALQLRLWDTASQFGDVHGGFHPADKGGAQRLHFHGTEHFCQFFQTITS